VSSIHLIRHAKAKNRVRWTERDELRPLTKRGRHEAAELASTFVAVPFVRLLSSPYARCLQTLEPLAAALHLPIGEAPELVEGESGHAAVELLVHEATAGAIACCTHGDVLFEICDLVASKGARFDGGPLVVPVAAAWILEVEGGQITRGHYVAPPPRA
jgi:8-oxo-dGTP diphosphatase